MTDADKKGLVQHLVDITTLDRSRRRWRLLAIILILIGIIFAIPSYDNSIIADKQPHIARVNVHGVIVDDYYQERVLDSIAADKNVQALIVHVDSPGGTMVGGISLYKALRRVAETKPVVILMGTTAASAGYLIALAGDYIIANEATTTGSIGVMIPLVDVSELAKKVGVKANFITSGSLKAAGLPISKMTSAERTYLQDTVDQLQKIFLSYVQKHRKPSALAIKTISDGRAIVGVEAERLGLIDSLGGMIEARDWLEKNHKIGKNTPIVQMELIEELNIFEQLASNSNTVLKPLQQLLSNSAVW